MHISGVGGHDSWSDYITVCDQAHVHVRLPSGSLTLDNADKLCPESYRRNSPNEVRLMAVADSFQRQYAHLCPDRRPLLLCPTNEWGVRVRANQRGE